MTLDEENKYVTEMMLFWKQKWQTLHKSTTVTLTRDDMDVLHDTATQLHALSLLIAAERAEASIRISDELLKQVKYVLKDVLKVQEIVDNHILRTRIKVLLKELNS